MSETDHPAAYLALLDATDGLLRQVVELHGPTNPSSLGWECEGCDFDGYEAERPQWPCRTTELIAEKFGVPLDNQ